MDEWMNEWMNEWMKKLFRSIFNIRLNSNLLNLEIYFNSKEHSRTNRILSKIAYSQSTFTCSTLTIETSKQGVKYVQS